jgi:sugar lactone lactonase YvrE
MVVDYGQVAGASDGLEADEKGGIYLTDYEHNAIHRFTGSSANMETIMYAAEAIWPDSLSLADDGYLYFTANQLNRQSQFHQGIDKRVQPYMIFRVKTQHQPIRQIRIEEKIRGANP